ncbi:hypothetical protein ACP4OV_017951 [Aristida adscensionis]
MRRPLAPLLRRHAHNHLFHAATLLHHTFIFYTIALHFSTHIDIAGVLPLAGGDIDIFFIGKYLITEYLAGGIVNVVAAVKHFLAGGGVDTVVTVKHLIVQYLAGIVVAAEHSAIDVMAAHFEGTYVQERDTTIYALCSLGCEHTRACMIYVIGDVEFGPGGGGLGSKLDAPGSCGDDGNGDVASSAAIMAQYGHGLILSQRPSDMHGGTAARWTLRPAGVIGGERDVYLWPASYVHQFSSSDEQQISPGGEQISLVTS